MESEHTPGPWVLTEGDRFESSCVITTHSRLDESLTSIAEVETDWVGPLGPEQRANAMLIAAAPDLLESLRSMVEMMDCGDESGAGSEWHTKAKEAIAKATNGA